MSQKKTFVNNFSFLLFFLRFCHGLQVTGEICHYANGVLDCKPEIISTSEKRKLLDKYWNNKCSFETYTDELHIEDNFCPSIPEKVNKPINVLINKASETIEDAFSSGMSEWSDDEDIPTRYEGVNSAEIVEDKEIEFHPRCAKNVFITSDHKTARRKNSPSAGFGSALTKEPLRPGQIFYVWVSYEKTPDFPCIGVTRHSPETIVYPEQMRMMIDGTWTWDTFTNEILRNGESIVKPFVYPDLVMQNGDRYGVSITDEGLIHFHHNGRDLGSIDGVFEEEVWGFVDMYLSGTNSTIAN